MLNSNSSIESFSVVDGRDKINTKVHWIENASLIYWAIIWIIQLIVSVEILTNTNGSHFLFLLGWIVCASACFNFILSLTAVCSRMTFFVSCLIVMGLINTLGWAITFLDLLCGGGGPPRYTEYGSILFFLFQIPFIWFNRKTRCHLIQRAGYIEAEL